MPGQLSPPAGVPSIPPPTGSSCAASFPIEAWNEEERIPLDHYPSLPGTWHLGSGDLYSGQFHFEDTITRVEVAAPIDSENPFELGRDYLGQVVSADGGCNHLLHLVVVPGSYIIRITSVREGVSYVKTFHADPGTLELDEPADCQKVGQAIVLKRAVKPIGGRVFIANPGGEPKNDEKAQWDFWHPEDIKFAKEKWPTQYVSFLGDLLTELHQLAPDILVFSGHGSPAIYRVGKKLKDSIDLSTYEKNLAYTPDRAGLEKFKEGSIVSLIKGKTKKIIFNSCCTAAGTNDNNSDAFKLFSGLSTKVGKDADNPIPVCGFTTVIGMSYKIGNSAMWGFDGTIMRCVTGDKTKSYKIGKGADDPYNDENGFR